MFKERGDLMKFAVIITCSFDEEVSVFLFGNEDAAKEFLCEAYKEEVQIDADANGYDVNASISEDGKYASIVCHFSDHDDLTEFRIGTVYDV